MSIQIVTERSVNGRDVFYCVASPAAEVQIVHEYGGGDLWRVGHEGQTAMLTRIDFPNGTEMFHVAAECLSLADAMAFAVTFVQEHTRTTCRVNKVSDDALENLRAKLHGN